MSLIGIVKVGASGSEIKFNSTKMLRAISFNDVEKFVSKNDASFLVFEQLRSDDLEVVIPLVARLVEKYEFKEDNVYFYKCAIDENAFKEHSYNYFSSLNDMQKHISFKHGINVRTYSIGVAEEIAQYEAEKRAAEEAKRAVEQEETKELQNIDEESLFDFLDDNNDGMEFENDPVESNTSDHMDHLDIEAGTDLEDDNQLNVQAENSELLESLGDREDNTDDIFGDSDQPMVISLDNEEDEDNVVIENDIEVIEKSEITDTEELKELREELNIKNERIKISDERIANLVKIRESLQDEVDFYKNLVAKISAEDDIINVQTKDSEETLAKLAESKHKIKQLEININNIQKELYKIDELRAELSERDKLISELRSDLSQARTDDKYKEISVRLEHEIHVRRQLLGVTKNLVDAYTRILDRNKDLVAENSTLKDSNSKLSRNVTELNDKLSDLKEEASTKIRISNEKLRTAQQKADDFNTRLIQSRNDLEVAIKEKEDALNRLSEIQIENNKITAAESDLKSELRTLKSEIEVQKNINDGLQKKIDEFNKVDIAQLREDKAISDMGVNQMIQELGRVKKELQATRFEVKRRDDTISRLEEEKNRMEVTNKSLSRNMASAEKLMIQVQYTSKASIIPVFSSGSYGSTTMAVSIAKRLPGKVLLLDFDCVNPKIDPWFEINPLIKTLDGLVGMEQTAFTALIKKGVDYVIEHRDEIFRSVSKKKGNEVVYFSGTYTEIDLSEFASVDFQQFLNFVGSEYNYIVVDLGRIGGNDNTNALIRMFNSISWRNVMVCLHDKYDLRTTYITSKNHKINYTKTIWALNMAKSTKLDDSMKKILGASNGGKGDVNYFIFMKDMDYYGERKTFTDFGNPNKDRLQDLVDKVTC